MRKAKRRARRSDLRIELEDYEESRRFFEREIRKRRSISTRKRKRC